ncbi:hypothetical protein PV379_03630 [Streptomyces caniscabiei]|uniref:hypothetical protein n=1 Tax=Streptomyces caniscabiei TaxID=2746961 RepID=UPI0029A349C6|nr:hypothetical protein [Streptomyces caniscabiei]MDX2776430.1 hypothetical protein [Streptomyces caniscabiei]
MAEKRYRSNKYVRCYCEKDVDILVGMKPSWFMNTFFLMPACIFLCVLTVMGTAAFATKVVIIACIAITPTLLARSFYKHARKKMLQWGHTEYCSRKIARQVMTHASAWSQFKIMKDKEN